MPLFSDSFSIEFELRVSTLGRIRTRSIGADSLTLSAYTVLAYAQLEGGVKDLVGLALRDLNSRNLSLGKLAPSLLKWRNREELESLKRSITFDQVVEPFPFRARLDRKVQVRPINRRREMNQMRLDTLRKVYRGFGLELDGIELLGDRIDSLVDARNDVAHHGALPEVASDLLENQLRDNVTLVEDVITDLAIRLLVFFSERRHLRA